MTNWVGRYNVDAGIKQTTEHFVVVEKNQRYIRTEGNLKKVTSHDRKEKAMKMFHHPLT